jgi:hypothetical protein
MYREWISYKTKIMETGIKSGNLYSLMRNIED